MASMQVCTLLHIHYSGIHKPMEKEDDINEILALAYFQLFKWPPPMCTVHCVTVYKVHSGEK